MDVCCLSRPFDDLSQERIYIEAEAILAILSHCESGKWTLMSSDVIDVELLKSSNAYKLGKIRALYKTSNEHLDMTLEADRLSRSLLKHGIKTYDSLHLALAETYKVDVFLTTDDRLLRASSRMNLGIKISNPVTWLMEIIRNED